ncbi:hypothetical protein [Pseudomonas chlororaphis]|uniref:hypothetical protein n=1 Tax=Pseudomonas chlororaphis TaxID=587753 RepID=UPI000F56564A|nr:hypothetical protein [Pseudomonas chlororaphis]
MQTLPIQAATMHDPGLEKKSAAEDSDCSEAFGWTEGVAAGTCVYTEWAESDLNKAAGAH